MLVFWVAKNHITENCIDNQVSPIALWEGNVENETGVKTVLSYHNGLKLSLKKLYILDVAINWFQLSQFRQSCSAEVRM